MKTKTTIYAGILLGTSVLKAEPVTPQLLDALSWAESGNNPEAVGKAGEIGRWQMTDAARLTVAQWRASMGEPIGTCSRNDPSVAADWLLLCNLWFYRQTGRMPTLEELLMVHNAPQLAKKRGFILSKMPKATQELVRRVKARLEKHPRYRQ